MLQVSTVNRKQLMQKAMLTWFATPDEVTGKTRTLRGLAEYLHEAHGQTDVDSWHQQLKNTIADQDFQRQLIQTQAAYSLQFVPEVISNLVEASNAGSIRAGEVFLTHVRQILSAPVVVNQTLNFRPEQMFAKLEVHADALLQLAQGLTTKTALPEGATEPADEVDNSSSTPAPDHPLDAFHARTKEALVANKVVPKLGPAARKASQATPGVAPV